MGGLVWAANLATLTVAMAAFGTGFGICQTSTLALMMDRVPASGYGMVSALWNMAYDVGYGPARPRSACSSAAPVTRPPSP